MSSDVLFCPQTKDIHFTVTEEKRNQNKSTFKKLKSENLDIFPLKKTKTRLKAFYLRLQSCCRPLAPARPSQINRFTVSFTDSRDASQAGRVFGASGSRRTDKQVTVWIDWQRLNPETSPRRLCSAPCIFSGLMKGTSCVDDVVVDCCGCLFVRSPFLH